MATATGYARFQRVLKLDAAACKVLDELAHGPHQRGRLVSTLLLQEQARVEEKERLRRLVNEALDNA
jgi:hypothetical protein